jgi:hypothetical protein
LPRVLRSWVEHADFFFHSRHRLVSDRIRRIQSVMFALPRRSNTVDLPQRGLAHRQFNAQRKGVLDALSLSCSRSPIASSNSSTRGHLNLPDSWRCEFRGFRKATTGSIGVLVGLLADDKSGRCFFTTIASSAKPTGTHRALPELTPVPQAAALIYSTRCRGFCQIQLG